MGTSKRKQQQPVIQEELQQSLGEVQQPSVEGIEEVDDDDSDDMAKDYHVCESSEQFFEPDFGDNDNQGNEPLQELLSMDAIVEEEAGNGSQDNQNTLILDSQSLILEAGDLNS